MFQTTIGMVTAAQTLDEVARTSDDAAVRARFDAATLTALRIVAVFFVLIAIPHLFEARTPFRLILGAGIMALPIALTLSTRRKADGPLARFVKTRSRSVAIGFTILQAFLIIFYNADAGHEATLAFAICIPFAALLFRLFPAEHVLLHGSLATVSSVLMVLMPPAKLSTGDLIAPAVLINAGCTAFALYLSRRMRRRTIAEFTERRASAREQIRMRDELRYARELQLSMLPDRAPVLDWAEVSSISVPATEVGGDYYDYFVADDHMALVCGDVAGHGLSAGLVLSALRGGFTLLRHAMAHPAGVLERLHDLVTHTTRRRMLVTVSVVLIDRTTLRATIASAGHPPVLIRRTDASVEAIELFAPPLGVRLPVDIPQREIQLAHGDAVILHSDGIYETRNDVDEVYGMDRLAQVVASEGASGAEALRDAIVLDVSEFRGGVEQDDDLTVVVCRVL